MHIHLVDTTFERLCNLRRIREEVDGDVLDQLGALAEVLEEVGGRRPAREAVDLLPALGCGGQHAHHVVAGHAVGAGDDGRQVLDIVGVGRQPAKGAVVDDDLRRGSHCGTGGHDKMRDERWEDGRHKMTSSTRRNGHRQRLPPLDCLCTAIVMARLTQGTTANPASAADFRRFGFRRRVHGSTMSNCAWRLLAAPYPMLGFPRTHGVCCHVPAEYSQSEEKR